MILTGLALGAVLGIVMQRGRFCVTGMLRDIFLLRTFRTFTALLIVIAVHAVGLGILTSTGVITPELPTFAPIAVIVGGVLFGIGIIAAGGCASGTWYRSGEGLIGSWMALIFYALSAAMMNDGALRDFNDQMTSVELPATGIAETLGISRWWLIGGLVIITAAMLRYFLNREAHTATPATLEQKAWRRPLNVYTAAAIIGVLGVIAWPLSAATGRNSGLGITAPSSDIAGYLVTGHADAHINWGVMLVLGILVGSFIAAKATGEFRLRVPDAATMVRSIGGGMAMGIGAALAGGCTVGNGMVQTSLFSWQGWIALMAITGGVWIGVKLWLTPKKSTTADKTTALATGTTGGFTTALGGITLGNTNDDEELRTLAQGHYQLDSLGAVCPFPLIEAKEVMNKLSDGDLLTIDFDCTQATEAIPRWAATDGHEVTDFHAEGDAGWQITLKKGGLGAQTPAGAVG